MNSNEEDMTEIIHQLISFWKLLIITKCMKKLEAICSPVAIWSIEHYV